MVGCYIFTAGSFRSDLRKTGKSPEGNKELMDLCALFSAPSDVYYLSVCVCVCVCVSNVSRESRLRNGLSHTSVPTELM